MHTDTVQSYALSRGQAADLLRNKLKPSLPYSLPLYRRCQFYLKATLSQSSAPTTEAAAPLHTASGGEVWVSFVQSATQPTDIHGIDKNRLDLWLSEPEPQYDASSTPSIAPSTPEWIASHIDLSNTGETQVWLFASWEPSSHTAAITSASPSNPVSAYTASLSDYPTRTALFRALFTHIRRAHVPQLPTTPTRKWQTIHDTGKIVSLPYRRSKILFGTVSAPLLSYFHNDVVRRPSADLDTKSAVDEKLNDHDSKQTPVREDILYLKYLIPVPVSSAAITNETPQNGRIGSAAVNETRKLVLKPLTSTNLQLMLDRTIIPRTLETVTSLVSVGLFPDRESNKSDSDPIAWGLLSKDASVASLHTEPEYRGRGLAEQITKELMRLQPQAFSSDLGTPRGADDGASEDIPFAHSDVAPSNKSSRRVFEKLGGKVAWEVAWVEVDVEEEDSRPD